MENNHTPHALYSSDGYLICQCAMAHIPYGKSTTAYSGCGWMAAYNFLLAMGQTPDADTLPQQLATGWFHGRMGTGPRRLRRFIQHRGFPLKTAITRQKAVALAADAKAGILLYAERGGTLHYVAFTTKKGEIKRFFNAQAGNDAHFLPLEEFLAQFARTPFCYLMVPR